jgi:probable DNA metabolism protein
MEIQLSGAFTNWKTLAREALRAGVPPSDISWTEREGQQDLFTAGSTSASSEADAIAITPRGVVQPRRGRTPQPGLNFNSVPTAAAAPKSALDASAKDAQVFRVPKRYISLARKVAANRDPRKWRLLYSVLWRIEHENHNLLKVETDDEVIQLLRMEDAVSRDIHHMHAFVRFRKIVNETGERFVAWYKPDHKIIELAAPFFVERFASMHWSLLTPDGSAHWNGAKLWFSEGVPTAPADEGDGLEALWSRYYATTFNPARTNTRMMRSEMPVRFWNRMPELQQMPKLLADAPTRVSEMIAMQKKNPGAEQFIPPNANLAELRAAIPGCEGCQLYCHATQPVFGEGPSSARVVLVGEQPGDAEDRAGRPFVGPAGEVLDRALAEVGLDRSQVYVTNAVKHFAFEERGKRRIHRTPKLSEVTACRPWLEAELARVRPRIVVCLGATAAKTVLGNQFRLTENRGKFLESRYADRTIATYHPSAVLRADSQESSDALYKMLRDDLALVAREEKSQEAKHAATAARKSNR